MKQPGWIRKMKNVISPRHGWKELHFFVKGESLCGKWETSIRGFNSFEIRNPTWKNEKLGLGWENMRRDCAKCTRIWLELYHIFKEGTEPRLFP